MAGVNDAHVQIRRATAAEAACLSALVTQAFLYTCATQGVRPDLAVSSNCARFDCSRICARLPIEL